MATQCGADWDRVQVSTGATKNLVATLVIATIAVTSAFLCVRFADRSPLLTVLKDAWFVQGVLVAAIVAIIYKLQSDVATLTNLSALQRAKLDSMVRIKSSRLWALFLSIGLSALLARVAGAVDPEPANSILTFITALLMVATTLYCFYLPLMWNELRQFLTGMVSEKEHKERMDKELKRLGESK